MKLSEALSEDRILMELQSANKEGALREMIDFAAERGLISDPQLFLERVLEREFLLSTGVGHGVAVPHAQIARAQGIACCLGISRSGVDYDSVDGEPVRIICLIIAEEENDAPYLRLLSQISRLFARSEVREGILQAESPAEVLAVIRAAEGPRSAP
ncbi:MAG: hypothetical protein KatS3mg115_0242 [Candidatus Poribacteria bacterium]|nr:MAG: hypothetical protein KatS3mg115_0242 [Candidatus Poribacteria bacterium]